MSIIIRKPTYAIREHEQQRDAYQYAHPHSHLPGRKPPKTGFLVMWLIYQTNKCDGCIIKRATSWQNPQNGMCTKRGLRSAWASTQSDQSSLCMKKAWVLSYPLSAQRSLWSDWADAQADPNLRWVHPHFVGFVMPWLRSISTILNSRVHSNMNQAMTKPVYANKNLYADQPAHPHSLISISCLLLR